MLIRYFLWFFFISVIVTCICGVVAALLPQGMGAILTIVPYLVAMLWVLHRFIRQQGRAPTLSERRKITLGFSLIYWSFNAIFLILGIVLASRSNPQVWQDFQLYLQNSQFLMTVLIMFLMIALPLYVLTYWFFGKQAERMAAKKLKK